MPLKDGSGRTPLNKTGRMRDGTVPLSGEDWVEIRATAMQAAWHQFGTDPYVIVARPGKARLYLRRGFVGKEVLMVI